MCDVNVLWLSTHIHTQPFYGSIDFVWDNPGELVPEEIFTHPHLLWSSPKWIKLVTTENNYFVWIT